MYSEKVIDHYSNPRNVGEIEGASGSGTVGNAKCGDIMKMDIKVENGVIVPAKKPTISAQCYRVPATDGHMAAVSVRFDKKPPRDEILARWAAYEGEPQRLKLPSAPARFLTYFEEENRPQTRLDRDFQGGFGVSIGRLREDKIFDYKFVCLSHNTVRGAAGGGILTAELLCRKGYIPHRV